MIAELIDIGYAFDDGAVCRKQLFLFDANQIADAQFCRRHDFDLAVLLKSFGDEIKSRLAKRRSFRLAASFSQSLGVVRKPHGEKKNRRDDAVVKARSAARPEQLGLNRQSERHQRSDPDDEHDGIANLHARVELEQGVLESLPKQLERVSACDPDASKLAAELAGLRSDFWSRNHQRLLSPCGSR